MKSDFAFEVLKIYFRRYNNGLNRSYFAEEFGKNESECVKECSVAT